MNAKLFDLSTCCPHLHDARANASSEQHDNENCPAALAVIAIGNSLRAEDRMPLNLLSTLQEKTGVCLFAFDSAFSWMQRVIQLHKSTIIVDTVLNDSGVGQACLTIPLTKEVLANAGFVVKNSHGLSWIDELKLLSCDVKQNKNLMFFGITEDVACRDESAETNNVQTDSLIKSARPELEALISLCLQGDNAHA